MSLIPPEPPNVVKRFWRSQFGRKLIHVLEPSRWWTIIFGIGAIAIITWTLTIYRSQARDEAAHAAEIIANADGQYNQCITSIPVLGRINNFIGGERIIRNTLVTNSYKVWKATPAGSSERAIRKANWERLRKARADAYEVQFPVPTKDQCVNLRARVFEQAHEKIPPLPPLPPQPTTTKTTTTAKR